MQIALWSLRKKPLFHIQIILIIPILPKYPHSRREQENAPLVSASCRVVSLDKNGQDAQSCPKPKMNLKYRFLTIGFVFQQCKGHILS